jgi:asparagine synthase (glutamine-hydrolysing)
MCGIAGIYAPGRRQAGEAVKVMLDSMAHRGPDDRGVQLLAEGQLAFGHLRLSILDLSPLGHQPMATPDRSAWIVYNGEIYNFRELRVQLAALGWQFCSDSDTEVILAAYRHWGLGAVERFRGMFAFALWDEARRVLHLCRDRFGVKPLYFSARKGVLAFASESKALNLAGHTGRDVNALSVAEFVQYGYISAPRSVFSDVETLRPGTICTFDEQFRRREQVYWTARDLFDGEAAGTLRAELAALPDEPLLGKVEDGLRQAFEYRMVSDVPVGLFLSGGIDSSLVAALLVRRCGVELNTFTIGYGQSEFDESVYARQVADALGAKHTEFAVSAQAALDLAVEIPEIADEPIGDSSLVPTLMVSRLAREHVKVALSADGADELFGGYARYAYCGAFMSQTRLMRGLYHLSAEILDRLPPRLIARTYAMARAGGPKFAAIEDKLRKFTRMSRAHDTFAAYDAVVSEWPTDDCRSLLANASAGSVGARETFDSITGSDARDRLMHFDMTRYLPGDLLVKVDRASMFVSLEAREPFLDHEAARIAAALPMRWKIRDGRGKYVLRRLLARHFPEHFFDRPKQGFSAPVGQWLRGPLRQVLLDELSPARLRASGLLDPTVAGQAVKQFLASDSAGPSPAGVWILLQLQQWAGRWLLPRAGQRTPSGVVAQ